MQAVTVLRFNLRCRQMIDFIRGANENWASSNCHDLDFVRSYARVQFGTANC